MGKFCKRRIRIWFAFGFRISRLSGFGTFHNCLFSKKGLWRWSGNFTLFEHVLKHSYGTVAFRVLEVLLAYVLPFDSQEVFNAQIWDPTTLPSECQEQDEIKIEIALELQWRIYKCIYDPSGVEECRGYRDMRFMLFFELPKHTPEEQKGHQECVDSIFFSKGTSQILR